MFTLVIKVKTKKEAMSEAVSPQDQSQAEWTAPRYFGAEKISSVPGKLFQVEIHESYAKKGGPESPVLDIDYEADRGAEQVHEAESRELGDKALELSGIKELEVFGDGAGDEMLVKVRLGAPKGMPTPAPRVESAVESYNDVSSNAQPRRDLLADVQSVMASQESQPQSAEAKLLAAAHELDEKMKAIRSKYDDETNRKIWRLASGQPNGDYASLPSAAKADVLTYKSLMERSAYINDQLARLG